MEVLKQRDENRSLSSRICVTNKDFSIVNIKDKSSFETTKKLDNVLSKEEMTISKVHAADESAGKIQSNQVVLTSPIPS